MTTPIERVTPIHHQGSAKQLWVEHLEPMLIFVTISQLSINEGANSDSQQLFHKY